MISTHTAKITAYLHLETGARASAHLLGTAEDGRPLYQSVEGYEPDRPYDIDEDGNWLPRSVCFDLRADTAACLPLDLAAVHDRDGGEVYRVVQYGLDGVELTNQKACVLWLGDIRRGGVYLGADSVWTDAASAEDCVRRVLLGEIVQ